MTLQTVIERLMRRKVEPVYRAPELITTFDLPEFVEIGETISASITSLYEIHDGGSLNTYRVEKNSESESAILVSATDLVDYNDDITFTDESITLSAYATYNSGPIKYDNLGNAYPDQRILAGTTEIQEIAFTPARAIFYGSLSTIESITSSVIRNTLRYLNNNYTNFEIEHTVPVGSRMIIFALPVTEGLLDEIQYREQSYSDILPNFDITQITVEAANGATGVSYNVYNYIFPFATTNKIHLKFIK
jgi:hypothetical protein